ncbi:MAG: hypothetical protein Q9180_008224, partial [Flavoplaca navasiana]
SVELDVCLKTAKQQLELAEDKYWELMCIIDPPSSDEEEDGGDGQQYEEFGEEGNGNNNEEKDYGGHEDIDCEVSRGAEAPRLLDDDEALTF